MLKVLRNGKQAFNGNNFMAVAVALAVALRR